MSNSKKFIESRSNQTGGMLCKIWAEQFRYHEDAEICPCSFTVENLTSSFSETPPSFVDQRLLSSRSEE